MHVATGVWARPDGSTSEQVSGRLVVDFDNDGLLDVLDAEAGTLSLGIGPRPGTLQSIHNEQGGVTTFEFTPSARMAPLGEWDVVQRSASAIDLVSSVVTEDTIDGDLVRTDIAYEDAVTEGGRFLGFETRTTTVYEPQLDFDAVGRRFSVSRTGGEVDWYLRSRETVLSELDRSGARPVRIDLETDHHLSVMPEFGHLTDKVLLSQRTDYTWADVDPSSGTTGSCTPSAGHLPRCLVAERAIRTWPEQLAAFALGGETTRLTYDYTEDGLLTYVLEADDLLGAAESIETFLDWSTDADRTLAVPILRELVGLDVQSGGPALLERIRWTWDDAPWGAAPARGWMTGQEVCAGPVAAPCSDVLSWSFSHAPRGPVDAVVGPKGHDKEVLAWQFGDALPAVSSNALGHTTTSVTDAHGRIIQTLDANGVVADTSYDVFGRPIGSAITGVGGTSHLLTTTVHDDLAVPRTSTSTRYAADGSPQGHQLTVLDGLGNVRESWTEVDDNAWVVHETLTDAFGSTRFTTVPETLSFIGDTPTSPPLTATSTDAFGAARVHHSDLVTRPGCFTATYRPGARRQVHIDESGRSKSLQHDAFGRLVEVKEFWDNGPGTPAEICAGGAYREPNALVATYTWSGRGQLQRLQDAADVDGSRDSWWYAHDLAGRLRSVARSSGAATPVPTASYAYDDGLPSALYRGTPTAADLAQTWAYDELGRLTTKRVRRPTDADDPATWPVWSITWDTRWVGMRSTAAAEQAPGAGPVSITEWRYDGATEGGVGNLGRLSEATRSWPTHNAIATFGYAYDLHGDGASVQHPSGTTMTTARNEAGRVTAFHLDSPGLPAEVLIVSYDTMGLPSGFTAQHTGHHLDVNRWSPVTLQGLSWDAPGGQAWLMNVSQQADGRLVTKSYEGGFESALPGFDHHIIYAYDWLGRVADVYGHDLGDESFDYDLIGNLEAISAGGETWAYTFPRPMNLPTERSSGSGSLESSTTDGVGRVTQLTHDADPFAWGIQGPTTNFAYDGGSKVRAAWILPETGPATGIRYSYDIDDGLTQREHLDAMGMLTQAELSFDNWQVELHADGSMRTLENPLPAVRIVSTWDATTQTPTTVREWLLREPDGHAAARFDDNGALLSAEVLGAYGSPLATVGTPAEEDGFQGMEADGDLGVVLMSVRHSRQGDGTWLQPEPLLHLGPPTSTLASPRMLFGPYASGGPIQLSDRSGYTPETGWDLFNVASGAASLALNVSTGNWIDAGVDSVGLVIDIAAAVTPVVPGGAHTLIQAARGADAAVDAVSAARGGSQVVDALDGGGQMIYRGMREGAEGVPVPGPTARTLGARPGTDIPIDADGMVHSGSGGMSVAPSPGALPTHRRPPEIGGTGKDPVWGMSTSDLPSDLQVVPDGPTHGTVQPSRSMTAEQYQKALCSTSECWSRQ